VTSPRGGGRRRPDDGSAVVDFVLVLVLLLPLVTGVIQLALVLHVRNTLASAAAEGARYAAVSGATAQDGRDKARRQVAGAISERYVHRIDVHPAPVGGAPGYEAVIAADVPVLGLGGPAIRLEVRGHAVAEAAP
jgi:hypothetical protein